MARRRARRVLLVLLVSAGLAAAGLGALWYWAAGEVTAALAHWSQEQRARGYAVSYGGPAMGGYPLAVTAELAQPVLASPHGWRWSGERLTGRAKVWAPLTLELALPRRQALALEVRGRLRELALETAHGQGAVVFDGTGAVEAAELELTGVTLAGVRPGGEAGWSLGAARLYAAVSDMAPALGPAGDPDYVVNGEAGEVTLPEGLEAPFGPKVSRLALQAAVFGRIPPGRPAEGLAAWRDAGGKVALEALALRYGPLEVLAKGELGLDGALRPEGLLNGRIGGLAAALDRLSEEGAIDKTAAFALKLSVLALSRQEDGTGRSMVDLPITLRDGLLYLGPVALFKLGPVI